MSGVPRRASRLFVVWVVLLPVAACVGSAPSPTSSPGPSSRAIASATPSGPSTSPSGASPSGAAPSGAATSTPIATAPPSSGAVVHVYFWSGSGDPCTDVVPVDRAVDAATPYAVLRALLAGPTKAEKAAGYGSWFSAATADALLGVAVRDGIAAVSFRDLRRIIPNASSSCGSGALLHALDATLTALPGITSTRYSFAGDEGAFYEWLQREPPSD